MSSPDKTPQEQFYRTLLESFFGAIMCVDARGRVVYANKQMAEMIPVPYEELIHGSIHYAESQGIVINSCVSEVLRTGKISTSYMSGTITKSVVGFGVPLYAEDGSIEYAVSYTIDEELFKDIFETLQKNNYERDRAQSLLVHLSKMEDSSYEIVAESPLSKELVRKLQRIAQFRSTVLLEGESGTGKEIYARTIFQAGAGKKSAFVAVNCAAIPEALLESEFFGYEPGAFTGASKGGKHGFFELADKGVLFLDEIGELPLSMQAKLLRVLETGEFTKLGRTTPQKVDVHIVAATNRDLEKLVAEGQFREDLFFRLCVFRIRVPPLRMRAEDILPLAQFFLKRYNQKFGMNKFFTPELANCLISYSWPGNVRELRNVIESMLITSPYNELTPNDFRAGTSSREGPVPQLPSESPVFLPDCPEIFKEPFSTLKDAMRCFECFYIRRAYDLCGENGLQTARTLGIHYTSLYKKLKEYGIR